MNDVTVDRPVGVYLRCANSRVISHFLSYIYDYMGACDASFVHTIDINLSCSVGDDMGLYY